ncbi:hypothetical protein [Brucella pituitosa]|uniref:hypothetical protein n=1 Tax=Brucella pituitosa TaxID=571256 RepID=UPI001AEDCC59
MTEWLVWFWQAVLAAQQLTLQLVRFYIAKAHFYDRFRGVLNPRKEKVVVRMFEAGPEGFVGGLSADNYMAIAKTSRATATRDLQDMVDKGALTRQGQLRLCEGQFGWRLSDLELESRTRTHQPLQIVSQEHPNCIIRKKIVH